MGMRKYVEEVNEIRLGDIESYEIGDMIGFGSFGKVYVVYRDGKRYAMKIPINANFDMKMVNLDRAIIISFKKEALNWADVSDRCPDSVIVFRDYSIEPFPWMVMEFGETDFKKHMDDGNATVQDVVILLNKLQKIHNAGIIHRDIKPENIMMAEGEWKFTDFGLAKTLGTMSQTMSGAGSAEYMAPEQWSPRKYGQPDNTTDLWAMGVILFRVLTGRSPYDSKDYMQMMSELMEYGPNIDLVPEKYRDILRTVFSFERSERFQSAEEFAEALTEIEGGGTVHRVRRVVIKENAVGSEGESDSGPVRLNVSNDGICEYNGFTFRLKASKLTLIKYSGLWDEVDIPREFRINDKNVPVTAIAEGVFRELEVTTVIIPDTVTSIGDEAFANCRVLATVIIPKSVKNIGNGVLKGCTGLSKLRTSQDDTRDDKSLLPYFKKIGLSVSDTIRLGCSKKDLKTAGFTIFDLRDSGCTIEEIEEAGFTIGDIRNAGFIKREVENNQDSIPSSEKIDHSSKSQSDNSPKTQRYTSSQIMKLKKEGYSAKSLRDANCSAKELKDTGYSAKDLKNAGYSLKELNDAGYSVKELRDLGYSAKELTNLGYSAKILGEAGYSVKELKDAGHTGYSAKELKDIGYSAKQLKDAGYSITELKKAGFTKDELSKAGFSAEWLKYAGFTDSSRNSTVEGKATLSELKARGYSREQLHDAGFTEWEIDNVGAESASFEKKDDSQELQQSKSYVKNHLSAKLMRDSGVSLKNLVDLGYSASELKDAGYTKKELKDIGFSSKQLREAGFTEWEIDNIGAKSASFEKKDDSQELQQSKSYVKNHLSAKLMRDSGVSLKNLVDLGYSASELKDAGYTKKELKDAGFSSKQLKEAGFKGLFL